MSAMTPPIESSTAMYAANCFHAVKACRQLAVFPHTHSAGTSVSANRHRATFSHEGIPVC